METLYKEITETDVAWLPSFYAEIAIVLADACYEVFEPHFSDGEQHAATLFLEEDIAVHLRRLRRKVDHQSPFSVRSSEVTRAFFRDSDCVEQAAVLFAVFDAMGVLHAWPLHAYLSRVDAEALDPLTRQLVQECRQRTPAWSLNDPTPWGDLLLHLVAPNGHPHLIRDLIAAGASAQSIDGRGRSLLHCLATGSDGLEMIAKLNLVTSCGIQIDHQDGDGLTPLHQAVRTRCADVARWLLDHGADVMLKTKEGKTAQDLIGVVNQDSKPTAQRQLIALFQRLLLDKGMAHASSASSRSRLFFLTTRAM